MVTFSVRLTEAQRRLLADAAELKGWSPTQLIRTAALEKAAHVVNTSRPTKIDFRRLASLVAEQLFKERTYTRLDDPESEEIDLEVNLGVLEGVKAFPSDQWKSLVDASHLSGTEF